MCMNSDMFFTENAKESKDRGIHFKSTKTKLATVNHTDIRKLFTITQETCSTYHKVLVERWGKQEWAESCHSLPRPHCPCLGPEPCSRRCQSCITWDAGTNKTHTHTDACILSEYNFSILTSITHCPHMLYLPGTAAHRGSMSAGPCTPPSHPTPNYRSLGDL